MALPTKFERIMHRRKIRILITVMAAVIIAGAAGLYGYVMLVSNTAFSGEPKMFYITRALDTPDVVSKLSREGLIRHSRTFRLAMQWTGINTFQPGRYEMVPGMNNRQMLRIFHEGDQKLVEVPVTHLRDVSRIAGRLAQYLEYDSLTYASWLLNPVRMDSLGFTPATWPAFFPAGTYSFRWTDHPSAILAQFRNRYEAFWTDGRKAKADQLGLTPAEVATLASIVKGETMKRVEAPRIAGLYLNRLRMGMPLQADPTVVFALGLDTRSQVLFSDLEVNSSYNTYRNPGLPPGPIFITEPEYLDAVLEYEQHAYIYMCALPGGSGEHAFASNYSEHLQNADAYRTWLRNAQNQPAASSIQ